MKVLLGDPLKDSSEGSKHSDCVATVRGQIDSGVGVGREAILKVVGSQGFKAAALQEVTAQLKAANEDDRIIKEVAARHQERLTQEAEAARVALAHGGAGEV
ncbi:MAG: hypothetical protein CTY20_00780 [Hyphomicrobium sp.]|nr:MAG: hypothetical protein CTY20_00780 [Hyphomicrobium sp.]